MFLARSTSCSSPLRLRVRRQAFMFLAVRASVQACGLNIMPMNLSVSMQRSTSAGPVLQTNGKDKKLAKLYVEKTYQQYYNTGKPIPYDKLVKQAQKSLHIQNPILRQAMERDREAIQRARKQTEFARFKWEQEMWETSSMFFEDKRLLW